MWPNGLSVDAPTQSGRVANGLGLNNNLFAAYLDIPEVSDFLSIVHPEYLMTSFLDFYEGRSIATAAQSWSYFQSITDRTRGQIASIDTAFGSNTITMTLVSGTERNFVPGRVAMITSAYDPASPTTQRTALRAIVTAIPGAGQITLSKRDGTVWNAAEISATPGAANNLLGSAYTLVGENSSAPNEWYVLPEVKEGNLSTYRTSFSITGDALSQATWVPGTHQWYYQLQWEKYASFRRDIEVGLGFNDRVNSGVVSGAGWVDTIMAEGQVNPFGGPMTESDLFQFAKPLNRNAVRPEYLFFCGNDYAMDVSAALKQYALDSSAVTMMTPFINAAGVNIKTYEVFNTRFHFSHYRMLDDPNLFTNQTGIFGGGAYRDWSKSAIAVNMGMDTSQSAPLIRSRHKEYGMVNRKMVYGWQSGMTGFRSNSNMSESDILGAGGNAESTEVVSDVDGMRCHFLAQRGMEMRLAYQHGIMWQRS